MRKTPSKMHMHDMVKIDTRVFEIITGEGDQLSQFPGQNKVKDQPTRNVLQ